MTPTINSIRLHDIRNALTEPVADTLAAPSEFNAVRRPASRTEIGKVAGMAAASNKSLEMMIGGLLEATQNMQRDITEIRRDFKDSDARAALSYEQSEQRAAASRAKMYQKTDELVETGECDRERGQQAQCRHDQCKGSHCRGHAMEADGARRAGGNWNGGSGAGLTAQRLLVRDLARDAGWMCFRVSLER